MLRVAEAGVAKGLLKQVCRPCCAAVGAVSIVKPACHPSVPQSQARRASAARRISLSTFDEDGQRAAAHSSGYIGSGSSSCLPHAAAYPPPFSPGIATLSAVRRKRKTVRGSQRSVFRLVLFFSAGLSSPQFLLLIFAPDFFALQSRRVCSQLIHGLCFAPTPCPQVPKDMDEEQLRPLFEQAGPIAHIMVIRDRQTDAHRGKCL